MTADAGHDINAILMQSGINPDDIDLDQLEHDDLVHLLRTLEELQELGSAVDFDTQQGRFRLLWRPQPRQARFLEACGVPADGSRPLRHNPEGTVIGFGGAAGGGKSDALLGLAGYLCMNYPGINIGYFRRQMTTLEQMGGPIDRSKVMFASIAEWRGYTWTFPTGGRLRFAHLNTDSAALAYKSTQFDVILFDEGTQFTRFQYRFMTSRNRATIDNFTPFMAIATNPGDIGHMWFKNEFVLPGVPERAHMVEVEPSKFERHVFVPSRLTDNLILMRRDPDYERKLDALPEKERLMYKDGDWNVFEGQFFSEFNRALHVVRPFRIPLHWRRFRSLDYGLDMLACLWFAVSPSGALYVYRELAKPDLIVSAAAAAILEATPLEERREIAYTAIPPDLFARSSSSGITTAETFILSGLDDIIRADNNRVEGWRQIRERLDPRIDDETGETVARVYVFSTCPELIRCLPELQHDPDKPDDCLTEPHDITHAPDALRYGVMSRPVPKKMISDETTRSYVTRLEQQDYITKHHGNLMAPVSVAPLAPMKAGRARR